MDATLILKYVLALLPMLMGVAIVGFMNVYTKWKHSARGISPSYFASVALLFALFASLIFSEVWGKITMTNALMTKQANSLRALLRLSEPLGPDSIKVANAVKNYIQRIKDQEVNDEMLAQQGFSQYKQKSFSKGTYQEFYLVADDSTLFKGRPFTQSAFYAELESVREAWFERREIRKMNIPSSKIIVLFIFGFFTQLAIAYSHIGNHNATRATVMLFSLAFAISIALLTYIDNPHQTSYLVSTGVLDDVK
jgi:hypothetical protein